MLLPQRPNEPDCIYYLKHGRCKYGSTCKYHHPGLAHTLPSDSSRCAHTAHTALYHIPDRDRSASMGSLTEVRDGQGSFIRGAASNGYQLADHHRRIVDSVPPQRRHEILDTISSYHQYSLQSIDGQVHLPHHRYYNQDNPIGSPKIGSYNQATPNGSPKIGSPSVTSSTMASSYDSVSGIEKLPPALMQSQNADWGRSLSSGNSYHSRSHSHEDAVGFIDATNPHAYEGPRISNVRHYTHAPNQIPPQRREDSYDFNGVASHVHGNRRVSLPDTRLPSSPYKDQSSLHGGRDDLFNQDQEMMRRSGRLGKPVNKNVDDGLSMMTSALLTMLDTPGNEQAETLSSHSSNYDDALPSITEFIPRSLPEYVSRPVGPSYYNGLEPSLSRMVRPQLNGQFATNYEYNHPNGLYNQQQHYDNQRPAMLEEAPRHQFGGGHGLAQQPNAMPKPAADTRRQWANPYSDTVGGGSISSSPTQFFLAP
jgi:hypothetical protein